MQLSAGRKRRTPSPEINWVSKRQPKILDRTNQALEHYRKGLINPVTFCGTEGRFQSPKTFGVANNLWYHSQRTTLFEVRKRIDLMLDWFVIQLPKELVTYAPAVLAYKRSELLTRYNGNVPTLKFLSRRTTLAYLGHIWTPIMVPITLRLKILEALKEITQRTIMCPCDIQKCPEIFDKLSGELPESLIEYLQTPLIPEDPYGWEQLKSELIALARNMWQHDVGIIIADYPEGYRLPDDCTLRTHPIRLFMNGDYDYPAFAKRYTDEAREENRKVQIPGNYQSPSTRQIPDNWSKAYTPRTDPKPILWSDL